MVDLNITIPDNFLQEEKRCGFYVSRQRKELWAIELDLMNRLDLICKQLGLKYFAGAGTLLGAIRHQGFIPWDDDMDFYMLRQDYDKLVQHANMFEPPYFLQNAYTDGALIRTHSRLRNSHTTACSDWEKDFPVNKGIFIDIFPLDGVSESAILHCIQKIKSRFYLIHCREIHENNIEGSKNKGVKKILYGFLVKTVNHSNKEKYFVKYENTLKQYSVEKTKMWGNRTLVFDCPRSKRPIEDWKEITTVPFEFTSIPIPKNYHDMLQQQYGNYMKLPEDKEAGKMHSGLIYSTDYSYDDPRRTSE